MLLTSKLQYVFTVITKIADSEGRTPLHWDVDGGHIEVAGLLE